MASAVSLAGLLLVFSGFIIAQVNTFDPERTPDWKISGYRFAARVGLLPFVVCLAVAGMTVAWTLRPNVVLLDLSVGGFFVSLFGSAVYGVYSLLRYL